MGKDNGPQGPSTNIEKVVERPRKTSEDDFRAENRSSFGLLESSMIDSSINGMSQITTNFNTTIKKPKFSNKMAQVEPL